MKPEVFMIASHGLAGDPWFYWLIKALNSHPEIFAYFGESSRAKYFHERSRKERPDVVKYVKWLKDIGWQYQAVGDCYAYRSYQLEKLNEVYGDEVRWVNVVRHPYCWLGYYTDWRAIYNVGAPPGNTGAIDHEWNVTCHDEIKGYDLLPYMPEDVRIWAFYQGCIILNRMVSDARPGVKNVRLEQLVNSIDVFNGLVYYLTHEKVTYPEWLLRKLDSLQYPEGIIIRGDAEVEYQSWPAWKKKAFEKIVTPEARAVFEGHGYVL